MRFSKVKTGARDVPVETIHDHRRQTRKVIKKNGVTSRISWKSLRSHLNFRPVSALLNQLLQNCAPPDAKSPRRSQGLRHDAVRRRCGNENPPREVNGILEFGGIVLEHWCSSIVGSSSTGAAGFLKAEGV